MRKLTTCAQNGVQPVYQPSKTVFGLCNLFVHYLSPQQAMYITHRLPAWLSVGCAPSFPLWITAFNRGVWEFIPTIHSPNNKSYMDTLRINIEKLWIGGYAI